MPKAVDRKYQKLYQRMERRAVVMDAGGEVCEALEMFLEEKKRRPADPDGVAEALWRRACAGVIEWRDKVKELYAETVE